MHRRFLISAGLCLAILAPVACGSQERVGSKKGLGINNISSWSIAGTPTATAIDRNGLAWAISETEEARSIGVFTGNDSKSLELDTQPGSRIGIVLSPFGNGVVILRIKCTDNLCEDGQLVVDLFEYDSGIVRTQPWKPFNLSDPGMPKLIDSNKRSLVVAVSGTVLIFGHEGSIEALRMTGQQGDPCVDSVGVVAVEPAIQVSEFSNPTGSNDTDSEAIILVRLANDGSKTIEGSGLSFDSLNSEGVRCSRSGLEIARRSQPATKIWKSDEWEALSTREIEWQLPDVKETYAGLVGLVEDSIILVDTTTGAVINRVQLPERLKHYFTKFGSNSTRPLSYRLAIGQSTPTALACIQIEEDSADARWSCDVFK